MCLFLTLEKSIYCPNLYNNDLCCFFTIFRNEEEDKVNIIIHDQRSREVLIPQVEQTDSTDKEDDFESDKDITNTQPEEHENEEQISDTPAQDEDDENRSSPLPLNPSDLIHSEIQLLTKSLMSQDSSILNILQSYDFDKPAEGTTTKKDSPHKLTSPSYEDGFISTPVSTRKVDSKVFEKKHNVSERTLVNSKPETKGVGSCIFITEQFL